MTSVLGIHNPNLYTQKRKKTLIEDCARMLGINGACGGGVFANGTAA